jgi:hypothetical protein
MKNSKNNLPNGIQKELVELTNSLSCLEELEIRIPYNGKNEISK